MKILICLITLLSFNYLIAQGSGSTVAYHQVKIGENLTIEIRGVPQEEQAKIAASYPVTKNGTIALPFLEKPIYVKGLTMDTIATKIQKAYFEQEIYTSPVIIVSSAGSLAEDKSRSEQIVTVGGEVKSPAQIPYRQDMTLYQAVQAAGGLTPFGSLKRVKLIRRGAEDQVYDLRTSEGKAVLVRPSDTIEVDERGLLGG
mgnify:CR=1 FL=1